MSDQHEEILKAIAEVQESADSAASYASEERVPLEVLNRFDDLSRDLREALKRLDNIERHMGIVPPEELEDE